ncbi:MAG: uracil-DNA glycosylase [bacterium]
MDVKIDPSWKAALGEEFEKPYFKELTAFVKSEYLSKKIFPPPKQIFQAFDATPFDEVKVVILGQDPYHGPGQAHGLCFSVSEGVRQPPSLQNIYKEIKADLGLERPESGNLDHWARQGVLLLNATLTVEANKAGSHQGRGWEEFTDAAVRALSEKREHLVFLLWGAYAQKKGAMIDGSKHLVLKCAHPSPFSADSGFFGCKHFSKTDEYLRSVGKEEIRWA